MKRGRIAYVEREIILNEMGREAEARYQYNLKQSGYKWEHFDMAFHWEPDVVAFDNSYWLDTGNEHLNKILTWLEYGTGLFGPKGKMIVPKTKKFMKFKINTRWIFARRIKGIKPMFAFTKAIESVRNERIGLQRQIRHFLNME